MKQDIATYLVDSFVDYAGKEHKIIACALSQTPEDSSHNLKVCWVGSENNTEKLNTKHSTNTSFTESNDVSAFDSPFFYVKKFLFLHKLSEFKKNTLAF